MRKKFKIYKESGELFKPKDGMMVVMNSQGVFFLVDMSDYYTYIRKLSDVIGNYSAVWNDEN